MNQLQTVGAVPALQQTILPMRAIDFGSYYDRFLQYLDLDGEKSAKTYMNAIKKFFEWMHSRGIQTPTRQDILDYRAWLEETPTKRTGKPMKPATRQNYITILRVFFSWLEAEGLYPNVANHIKGAKVSKKHKKDFFTPEDANIILDDVDQSTLQGKRDYALLMLMFYGGFRTIELSRANVEDLDKVGSKNVLYVQRKGSTEKDRDTGIKLDPAAYKAVRNYLKARKVYSPEDPLFISLSNNSAGKRLTTQSISGIAKRCFRAAGFDSDRLTAHSCRRSAITWALEAGESVQEVKEYAGHADYNTTMIYADNVNRMKSTVEGSIASRLGRKK